MLFILGCYFIVGIIVLLVFDIVTGRIRKRLKSASVDAQIKLAQSGNMIGAKAALVVTILALWLFYPLVIYSAVINPKENEDEQKKR